MKGLVFDTENRIQLKDFGEPLLDNLQKEVGGCIEVVHPKYLPEGLCMVIDDEGLLKGYAINSIASILYGTPEHGQPIVGTAVILREGFVAGELDFMSLDDGDEVGLMLLFSALGICIKNESEAECWIWKNSTSHTAQMMFSRTAEDGQKSGRPTTTWRVRRSGQSTLTASPMFSTVPACTAQRSSRKPRCSARRETSAAAAGKPSR